MGTIERNIYYDEKRILNPYHVRIFRKGKQVFFRCCPTVEEARRELEWFKTQSSKMDLCSAGKTDSVPTATTTET
jgi:hypothetical protein